MIFIDTGAFFASIVINDMNHQTAIEIENKIKEGKFGKMFTTNYILDELYTLLKGRVSHVETIQIGETIRKSPNIRIIWILDALEEKSFIIADLLKDLFTYKQLSLYQRDASLTITDMMKKKDLPYLRKIFYLALSHDRLERSLEWSATKLGQAALSRNYDLPKDVKSTEIMHLVTKAILRKQDHFLSKLPEAEQIYHKQKNISVLPHRSSQGLSTNHYRKNFGRIAVSIYAKNKNWLQNKIARVTRSRRINLSDLALDKIAMIDQTANEKIRFEVSLWGFKTIHCDQYHLLIDELETFIANQVEIYKKNTMLINTYEDLVEESSKMIPAAFYDPNFEHSTEIIQDPAECFKTLSIETFDAANINSSLNNFFEPPD